MDASIQNIKKRINPTLRNYGIKKAAIFGSFAKGKTKENSDIDILVEFPGNKSLLDLVDLKFALEEILGRKVDVLTYDSLHPLLKDIILKEQRVIL